MCADSLLKCEQLKGRERERQREQENLCYIINNISLDLIFALAREFVAICTRLGCLLLSFSFLFFILMNYYALHNFRQLMTLSSGRFIYLPAPFSLFLCAVMCRGEKRKKKKRKFWPFACPGLAEALPHFIYACLIYENLMYL